MTRGVANEPSHTPYFSVIHGTPARPILHVRMRKVCLFVLAALLLLPVVASADELGQGAAGAAGDGSLVVSKANGRLTISGRGLIFGHVESGTIIVTDYRPDDTTAPSVSGGTMKLVGRKATPTYAGSDMRFLFPGGKYTLTIDGTGIDISAVGTGKLTEAGPGITDGTYSVDGGPTKSVSSVVGSASYGKGGAGGNGNGSNGNGSSVTTTGATGSVKSKSS